MLKSCVLISIALFSAGTVVAEEEGGIALQPAGADIRNTESLQRGARNFMNYCSGCHSLKYLRYNRLGADLEIPEAEVVKNLIFTGAKPFDEISTAMPADATDWFGKPPPDLTLMARDGGGNSI